MHMLVPLVSCVLRVWYVPFKLVHCVAMEDTCIIHGRGAKTLRMFVQHSEERHSCSFSIVEEYCIKDLGTNPLAVPSVDGGK